MSKSNSLGKRIFAAIIAGTMAVSLSFSLTGCNDDSKTEDSNSSKVSQNSVIPKFENDIAIKTKNYTVPYTIVTYFFNYYYRNYYNSYGQYMAYYGFDANLSLRDQYYDEENKKTWYDFFMEETKSYISETLILAEAAKADGMELSKEELSTIDENMSALSKAAESDGITEQEYVEKNYGKGVKKEDVKDFLKITTLAQNYYNKIYNGYKYTDTDYENYYTENKNNYHYADFLTYTFNASYGSDATDEQKKEANEKAKAYADALSKCKTVNEYKAYVKKYLTENPSLVETTSTSSSGEESKMTEEEIANAIDSKVESTLTKKYAYEVSSDVGKWIFDDGRKALETKVIESTDAYMTVMIVKPAYRDETTYKNVRHILIQSSSYESDDKAKAKADEVYNEWKKGKATEETFAELANKYSEDGGSNTKGGLYENIYEGQMVQAFNDWCFDASRKVGDTGIVKTNYGYHIMYFSGNSDVIWKTNVDKDMRTKAFNEHYKKLQEKFAVEYDDDYINTIELFETDESSSAS